MKENEGGKDKFKSLDLIYIIPYKRDSQQGPRCTKGVQHSCNNLYGEKIQMWIGICICKIENIFCTATTQRLE